MDRTTLITLLEQEADRRQRRAYGSDTELGAAYDATAEEVARRRNAHHVAALALLALLGLVRAVPGVAQAELVGLVELVRPHSPELATAIEQDLQAVPQ